MPQVSWSSADQADPASSRVARRPPGATRAGQLGCRERLPARALLRRVDERPYPRHLQSLGLGGAVGARPERQERAGHRRVPGGRGLDLDGEDAELAVEGRGRERHRPAHGRAVLDRVGHLVRLPGRLERRRGEPVAEVRHLRRETERGEAGEGLHGEAADHRPGVIYQRPGDGDRGVRARDGGRHPGDGNREGARAGRGRPRLRLTGRSPHGRYPRGQRGGSNEEDSEQRTEGADGRAHSLHVMAVRSKGLG